MQTNLIRLLPNYYHGVSEANELMRVENELFDKLKDQTKITVDNQFVTTCDANMLTIWEGLLQINSTVDVDINFRRERIVNRLLMRSTFTLWSLKERLSTILGNNYELIIDYGNYELLIETTADSQAIFNEMIITVYRTKPANIIFRLVPVLSSQLYVETRAFASKVDYKRAGYWIVGETPIEDVGKEREVMLHVD